MFKQLIFIIIVSGLAAFFSKELYSVLHALAGAQNFIVQTITNWLPVSKWYNLISKIITLVLLPVIMGFLAAFFYWLIKHEEMPHLRSVIWSLWIISLLIFILSR